MDRQQRKREKHRLKRQKKQQGQRSSIYKSVDTEEVYSITDIGWNHLRYMLQLPLNGLPLTKEQLLPLCYLYDCETHSENVWQTGAEVLLKQSLSVDQLSGV
jgi:hypothetical protein